MIVNAVLNPINQRWAVEVLQLARCAIIEARIVNTLTGKQIEQYVEADSEGVAVLDLPDFGRHYAITVRVLTERNPHILHKLYFDSHRSSRRLTMSTYRKPQSAGADILAKKRANDKPTHANLGG